MNIWMEQEISPVRFLTSSSNITCFWGILLLDRITHTTFKYKVSYRVVHICDVPLPLPLISFHHNQMKGVHVPFMQRRRRRALGGGEPEKIWIFPFFFNKLDCMVTNHYFSCRKKATSICTKSSGQINVQKLLFVALELEHLRKLSNDILVYNQSAFSIFVQKLFFLFLSC